MTLVVSTNIIYGLVDQRTKAVRYIGKSERGLERPEEHRTRTVRYSNTYCANWLKGLFRSGSDYDITILDTVDDPALLNDLEIWWIAHGRALGWPLTNLTPGGTGFASGDENVAKRPEVRAKLSVASTGRRHTEAAKRKQSKARMGKPGPYISPEVRERLRVLFTGKFVSQETRAKQSLAHTGFVHTEEAKAKMSLWRTGDNNVSKRPEVRAKLSEGHKVNPKVLANIKILADRKRVKNVPCGTRLGYARAIKARNKGEPNCGPCKACLVAASEYAKANRPPPKLRHIPCGTLAGHDKARRDAKSGKLNCGPCEPCLVARRVFDRERYRQRKK